MSWAEEQPWFGLEDLALDAIYEADEDLRKGHDIPYDMMEYISSEDTDWNSAWMSYPTETLWECKDGTIIAIEDMETSHIKNCVAMINRSIKANKPWRTEYLEPLTEELKRREQNVKKI